MSGNGGQRLSKGRGGGAGCTAGQLDASKRAVHMHKTARQHGELRHVEALTCPFAAYCACHSPGKFAG